MMQMIEELNDAQKTIVPLNGSCREGHAVPVAAEAETTSDFDVGIERLAPRVGLADLSEKERQILFKPVDEGLIEIRPDGLIYLNWTEYASRLRDAFGLDWSLVPQGMPKLNGNSILWGFRLIIRGRLCGFAFGESEYQADNRRMSWGDACESAKSNALMRLCKGLGVSLDLWKPSFVADWKSKHAETFWDSKKGKNMWRKKPVAPVHVQSAETEAPGRLPYREAFERFSRPDGGVKPSGNGRVNAKALVERIQNSGSLESLKALWRENCIYLNDLSPEEKDSVLEAKDLRKLEFITKNERGFLNGRK